MSSCTLFSVFSLRAQRLRCLLDRRLCLGRTLLSLRAELALCGLRMNGLSGWKDAFEAWWAKLCHVLRELLIRELGSLAELERDLLLLSEDLLI